MLKNKNTITYLKTCGEAIKCAGNKDNKQLKKMIGKRIVDIYLEPVETSMDNYLVIVFEK